MPLYAVRLLRFIFAPIAAVVLIAAVSIEPALPTTLSVAAKTLQFAPRKTFVSVTLPTGRITRLSARIINGQQYASIPDLAAALFPGGIAREAECKILFKNESLRLAPASFLVAHESFGGEERIAQMNMPVIAINAKPLAPIPQFFAALQTLGVFTVQISDAAITLKMAGQAANTPARRKIPAEQPMQRIAQQSVTPSVAPAAPQPGRYNLPVDLDRSPIADLPDEIGENTGPIAYAEAQDKQNTASITAITAYRKDSILQIRFTANRDIYSFQKPETEGNEIIVRFPDMNNAVRELGTLADMFPIKSARVENIRQILVFRIRLHQKPISCAIRRIGSRKVILDIIIIPSEKNIKKTAPDKSVEQSDKWKLDVVVLDAGHGGIDEGATSISGIHEKDVTLAIALKTRDYLNKILPDVKVVLTRSADTFIALDRRGQIANEAGGKLFVSIHCNSMPSKPHPAHGFEAYILRPGRNAEAVAVAERENSSVKFEKKSKIEKLSEEQIIVATMAQAAFVKFSELFATILQQEMKKRTTLTARGISQAGFLVLVGASMPNMLFETAFLSNESDEKFISSAAGQSKTAKALADAIARYARDYAKAVEK
ncbi:hypothetical protein MASR2M18_11660 [Ignavibacteria bacterium]|nr:N-acetylmuramoyl-L-alanine amidase [Bacteroidota bacterium]